HDFLMRDFGSPSCNPDIMNLDLLIDALVESRMVDPKRIYVMGHSNGAIFGQMYAIARHVQPTPGGNRVAAAAVYAGFDPFSNLTPTQSPSCRLATYPATDVPIFQLHRACDSIVPCDDAQNAEFYNLPGGGVERWLTTLGTTMADPSVR